MGCALSIVCKVYVLELCALDYVQLQLCALHYEWNAAAQIKYHRLNAAATVQCNATLNRSMQCYSNRSMQCSSAPFNAMQCFQLAFSRECIGADLWYGTETAH